MTRCSSPIRRMMPITLYPLMRLPTVAGAMCWFAIKVAMTTAVLIMCFRIAQPTDRVLPPMFRSLVLLLESPADPRATCTTGITTS